MASKNKAAKTEESKAMVQGDAYEPELSQAELMNLIGNMSFEETRALAEQEGAPKIQGTDVVDKEALIDVPLCIVHTVFRPGTMGEYVSVTCKVPDGSVIVFNDGSTGVREQLRGLTITPKTPLFVAGGLRRSDYTFKSPTGAEIPASTYYLNPSKPKRLGPGNGTPWKAPALDAAPRIPRGTAEIP